MNINFSKNHKLTRVGLENWKVHGVAVNETYKITPRKGSTFLEEAILVGRQEHDRERDWQPVSPFRIARHTYDSLKQPRHQVGTWVDKNNNHKIEENEVRTLDDRVGDVSSAGAYTTLTLDLAVTEGAHSAWYIREDLGVL